MEEGIVSWKSSSEGEKELLTGELRDQAGSAGSDWFAFDVARMGSATEEQRAAYLARLQDAVEAVYANKEDSMMRLRISDIHRMALTVIACGGDPENFGTDPDGNPINLIHDTVWNSNSCWGDPGDQGINGYIWALLTIDAKNYQEPEGAEWTREKLISELLSRQLADGGFGLIKTDPSDVDLTSMVLTALAPYRGQDKTYTYTGIISGQEETSTVDAVAEKAFARLSELQADDGSMLTYDERTSESTAWAMIALASWGRDPEQDGAFIKNGKTLIDGMQAFCLADGGIIHSLDSDEKETEGNNMAGYQTLYGLGGSAPSLGRTDETVRDDRCTDGFCRCHCGSRQEASGTERYRYNRYTQQRGSGGGCQQQNLISDCWYCRCDRCGGCDFPCSGIKREQKEKSVGIRMRSLTTMMMTSGKDRMMA